MITRNMSEKEVIAELKNIDVIVHSRIKGYLLKYKKGLKSKQFKHNDVLGVQEYSINGNKVILCFQKIEHTNKLSDLGIATIVIAEYGVYIPFWNDRGNTSYVFLTKHSIDRLWQRLGLTVKEFFVNEYCVKSQTAHHLVKYDGYGNDDSTYVLNYGEVFFIATVTEQAIICKTCLDLDRLYSNQLKLFLDSKVGGEKYRNKVDADYDKQVTRNFKKTDDIYRKFCA